MSFNNDGYDMTIREEVEMDYLVYASVMKSEARDEGLIIEKIDEKSWVSYMLANFPKEHRYGIHEKAFPAYSILYKIHELGWKTTDKQRMAVNNMYMIYNYGFRYDEVMKG